MAPSLDCLNISLFCAEEAQGSDWEDEVESFNGQQCGQDQGAPQLVNDKSALHDLFMISDHLFEEDDEVIQNLMQKEVSFMPQKEYAKFYNGSDSEDLQESRERAIYWMRHVQAYYGFSACTAFLSVSYFDRFLARQHVNSLKTWAPWLVQLLAVGCMSLAAKVEETEVPLPLHLQVGHVPNMFEARTIQRMELLILSTLEWRLNSVTPFCYIGFLLRKIAVCARLCSDLLSRLEELILNSCRELRFLGYTPSVLAIASVMCACEELPPHQARGCKLTLLSVWPNRKGTILECAGLMQELLLAEFFWTSKRSSIVSPTLNAPESPNGVLDTVCFSCESENTVYSSFKFAKRGALLCSGAADHCTSFKAAIATAAAAGYSRSPSPLKKNVRNRIDLMCGKRKFNERYSNLCIRSAPAPTEIRADTEMKQSG